MNTNKRSSGVFKNQNLNTCIICVRIKLAVSALKNHSLQYKKFIRLCTCVPRISFNSHYFYGPKRFTFIFYLKKVHLFFILSLGYIINITNKLNALNGTIPPSNERLGERGRPEKSESFFSIQRRVKCGIQYNVSLDHLAL